MSRDFRNLGLLIIDIWKLWDLAVPNLQKLLPNPDFARKTTQRRFWKVLAVMNIFSKLQFSSNIDVFFQWSTKKQEFDSIRKPKLQKCKRKSSTFRNFFPYVQLPVGPKIRAFESSLHQIQNTLKSWNSKWLQDYPVRAFDHSYISAHVFRK